MLTNQLSLAFNIEYAKQILKNSFSKGFLLDSFIETKRFRRIYFESFSEEIFLSDKDIQKQLQSICFIYKNRLFLVELLDNKTQKKLEKYIIDYFQYENSVLYYIVIYKAFGSILENCGIYNSEMLKSYLLYRYSNCWYMADEYVAISNTVEENNLVQKVISFFQTFYEPVSLDSVFSHFSYIPKKKVKEVLTKRNGFICDSKNYFIHVSMINFTDNDIEYIRSIIQDEIQRHHYMTVCELYNILKSSKNELCENITVYSKIAFREILAYKLRDYFSFNGNVISDINECLTSKDIFSLFSQKYSYFRLEELLVLAKSLETVPNFEIIYEYAIRISHNEFISKNKIYFAIDKIDVVLDGICSSDFIPLQNITYFDIFPSMGFSWNIYMLENYVAFYSRKYKLLHISFNISGCFGVIAKRTSAFSSYNDIIMSVLESANIYDNKSVALNYLAEHAFIGRRRLENIDSILEQIRLKKRNML